MTTSHYMFSAVLCILAGGAVRAYYPTYWSNQYGTSPARSTCSGKTPCYDVVLTYMWDGLFEPDNTPGELERAFASAGIRRTAAVQLGRDAIAFFTSKYGISLPPLTDAQLLDNTRTVPNAQGDAVFMPFIFKTSNRYRLYTATVNEEAQFFNAPLLDYGYMLIPSVDIPPSSTFNQTIPAGALLAFCFYTIDQCPPSRSYGSCRHSILTPHNPREKITIHYRTTAYIQPNLPPTRYFVVDCELHHPVWGAGAAHGYFPHRGSTEIFDARNVLTFPSYRP